MPRSRHVLATLVLVLAPRGLCARPASPDTELTPAARPAGRASPASPAPPPTAAGALTSEHLRALSWRSIGPANMGGRIADIAIFPGKPGAFLVGTATGGLFKTGNHGTTFAPVFDDQPVVSIGSIAVSPSNPAVIWAGTGEGNGRNSSTWGNGVYKSTDGGQKFFLAGLEDSRDVPRMAVDPCDPGVAYAAVMGHLWDANSERGLYRTTDGGATWKPLLQVDADTGCIDVALDPVDSRVIYAAMYSRRRLPWSFRGGFGEGGGIYKSEDGGKTFRRLTRGLPRQTGRIALAVYPGNESHLLAVIESDERGAADIFSVLSKAGGVFRSSDGGEHWTRLNPLTPRPFYFSKIVVDPKDEKRVYVLGFGLAVSDDGGVTFRPNGAPLPHGDMHALAIDPGDTSHLLMGTDGGVYESWDRAASWRYLDNLAIGEFYEIGLGMDSPYTVCGGLQDNGSWCGPSQGKAIFGESPDKASHISNQDWQFIFGGDGYYVQIDPRDPGIRYAEAQQGFIGRIDLASGRVKLLRPSAKEGSEDFRFNWDSPILLSRHDPDVVYLGGNRLFQLDGRGERWEMLSPDLSARRIDRILTVGSGAENHGTIVALAESPLTKGLLWAGTDDGKVQVTRDHGQTWTDVTTHLAAPRGTWVSRIEASHFDPETAIASLDGHRTGDNQAYVIETRDLGRTWRSIAGDLPPDGPVKVVREDPVNPDLLFAGTEFGAFVSVDRGRRWLPLRPKSFPAVMVHDLQIHPRDRDVVIGTHGRSVYVLDDITPLEQLTPEVIVRRAHLFVPRTATGFYLLDRGGMWGNDQFTAKNPPAGAVLNYWVKERDRDGATLSIQDGAHQTIRELHGPAEAGLNRVTWDLQADRERRIDPPEADWTGQWPLVPAGTYEVTLSVAGESATRTLVVSYPKGVGPEPVSQIGE